MTSRSSGAELKKIIADMVRALGYECVGTEIGSARGAPLIRVYIDSPGGVRHADCELVSRSVSERIDGAEGEGVRFFQGKYFIEVSSPGIERPLFTEEHYERFAGRDAAVVAKNSGKVAGQIVSCANGALTMKTRDGAVASIPFGEIKRGNLVYAEDACAKKNARQ
ncbi:MAG: ribosome maturation factor RimP [Synergistaceae bacterium]|jgi:ribosome maturation factor RimP|nr:ribosome maturation factor RimP [Synergistaceae bacterium]